MQQKIPEAPTVGKGRMWSEDFTTSIIISAREPAAGDTASNQEILNECLLNE